MWYKETMLPSFVFISMLNKEMDQLWNEAKQEERKSE